MNIKRPATFNINADNFNDNYFKFYNKNGINGVVIDPVLTKYMNDGTDNININAKTELNTIATYLLRPPDPKNTNTIKIEDSSNFSTTNNQFSHGTTNTNNPVHYNIKVKAIENIIKNLKESIAKTQFISPLQSVFGIIVIFLTVLLITRLFHLDFLDGIFGKVLENKTIGIDNIFKRMFLVFYLFIIANLGFIVINFLWGYSDYLLSLTTSGRDNDGLFVLIGFIMSIVFLGPTYLWAYMSTNRFTRYVIIFAILSIHLLFIDWLSIPAIFNRGLTTTNDSIDNKVNLFSQILLFILVILVIIYALYFKFHNKEIFASGYKNKMMYFIFFALLVCISGYSSFIKSSYCTSSYDNMNVFCKLLSAGKISLMSLGSLIAVVTFILGTIMYRYLLKKPLPDIEADSTNYFFVKTK